VGKRLYRQVRVPGLEQVLPLDLPVEILRDFNRVADAQEKKH
jgi:hypothetical protein